MIWIRVTFAHADDGQNAANRPKPPGHGFRYKVWDVNVSDVRRSLSDQAAEIGQRILHPAQTVAGEENLCAWSWRRVGKNMFQ